MLVTLLKSGPDCRALHPLDSKRCNSLGKINLQHVGSSPHGKANVFIRGNNGEGAKAEGFRRPDAVPQPFDPLCVREIENDLDQTIAGDHADFCITVLPAAYGSIVIA